MAAERVERASHRTAEPFLGRPEGLVERSRPIDLAQEQRLHEEAVHRVGDL